MPTPPLPADQSDGSFGVPARGAIEAGVKTSLATRIPGVDVTDNSPADIDAKQIAGVLSPGYARGQRLFNATSLQGKRGPQLAQELASRGDGYLPAAGAIGWVLAHTGATGAPVPSGLTGTIGTKTYKVLIGGTYTNGQPIPIQGIDTGPSTDQAPGALLTWNAPPGGLFSDATVMAQGLNAGLVGGADQETDPQVIARLAYQNANPAASGNESDYVTRGLKCPGVAFAGVFAYPCILGGNVVGIVAVMRQAAPTDTRIPTTAQIAALTAWLPGAFPKSDVILVGATVANPLAVPLLLQWTPGIAAWTDALPWPAYNATPVAVNIFSTPTATTFKLTQITGIQAQVPAAGMSIAFYDAGSQVFRRKKILTATLNAGDYDIVCDTSAGASDTTYTPVIGQPCCPWSDALGILIPPMVTSFNLLGPGEQLAANQIWDPNLRQRRSPAQPQWPYVLTHKVLDAIDALAAVADVQLPGVWTLALALQSVPYTTPAGSAGVSSNLSTMAYLCAYPE